MKPAKKEYLNTITHSVRVSQAVLQYGVGAMVDFPDQTLMTAAPEYWQEQVVKIHDAQQIDSGFADAVHVQHNGTKLSNMSFPEIWQYALESVDEPREREVVLLNTLSEISSAIPVEEDPLFGESVHLVISGEIIETDLIWEQAHVMLFLSDNEANYIKAKSSNWKCFYTDDPSVTANEVLTTIKGEY